MKKFLLVVMVLLSLSSVGCAEPARNLSTSVNEFCWKYFATLDRKQNIFYSPYGINCALSILANGATGETLTEIIRALEADNLENLNACHENFSAHATKNYANFSAANLLLVDKKIIGRGLDKNFSGVVADVYKSDVRAANFSGDLDGEKKKISRRVNDKTNGFIPDYKSIATADTLTDLLNVVYFKDAWKFPFNVKRTTADDFKNLDGSLKKVDMMSKTFERKISYCADEKFKGIELPYRSNAAMYVILPANDDLDVADAWNAESFSYRENFLDGLSKSPAFRGEVVVRLPKFELDIENNLVENFRALGMRKSFSDAAEFTKILNGATLKFDNVQHRAKVKVDEHGTEAAAVTEIPMVATAAPNFEPPPVVYFIANRPFLFVIRDVRSGVTLFAGVVNSL